VKEQALVARLSERLGLTESAGRQRLSELRGREAGGGVMRKVPAEHTAVADAESRRKEAVESLQRRPGKDDLLECELLEVLFTAPRMIQVVRQEIGIDDLHNEALRDLLAGCFDLWDHHGDQPDFPRVLAMLECPHLKRLAVWLESQAELRKLRDKLVDVPVGVQPSADHASAFDPAAAASTPWLVQQVLDGFRQRRARAGQLAAKGEWADRLAAGPGLSADVKQWLAQSARYHQTRAAGRPAGPK
jgi:hypothetical protein